MIKHKNSDCNCKECKHKLVIKTFIEANCEILGEISLTKKIKYKCNCGEIAEIKWFNFKNGERCKKCAIKRMKENNSKRLAVEKKIYDFFKDNNCTLLEKNYINQTTKMKYICECGNKSLITWKAFQKGCRCNICAKNKVKNRFIPSGKYHFRWNPNREEVELNKIIRQKAKHMLKRTLLGKMKEDTTFKLLGYSKEELISHIINHENWINVCNTEWELDHIFPMKAFFENGIYDVKIINKLTNLRPLSKIDNRIKNDSYDKISFEKWINQ